MPHRTQTGNRRTMSEREREQRRQEEFEHGGWYAAMKWRREQREQASTKEGLNNAEAAPIHKAKAQKVP